MLRYALVAILSVFLMIDVGIKAESAYRHRVRGWTYETRTVRIRFDSFSGDRTIDTADPECYQHLILDQPLHGNCYE